MALKLTKNAALDFSGTAGQQVTLGIVGENGVAASILSIGYNAIVTTAAPFTFTIAQGGHGLVVLFVAAQEGAEVDIQEVDGANSQSLAQPFFHKSIPNVTILIRGR